ncbi:MAG: hypothetical protein KJO07_15460, partial [Deltaproteobacteria bacterium]|nr:hypothetical protein [Deltaproteobacteria bacterium]
YGAYAASLGGGWNWITYGLIGALVGLLVGRPIWRHLADRSSTIWTPLLKAIFGFGVAVGLYALAAKVWGGFEVQFGGGPVNVINLPFALGGAVGAIYGAFVEVDDADSKASEPKSLPAKPSPK